MNAGHVKSADDSLHVGFVVLARRAEPAARIQLRARKFGVPGIPKRAGTSAERMKSQIDNPIYLPSDVELMAARGAIISDILSIANGNLEPLPEVLDTIIKAVVVSLRWRPPT